MWRMGRTPGHIRSTGRALGANTEAILTDKLGLSSEQVQTLRGKGVVA